MRNKFLKIKELLSFKTSLSEDIASKSIKQGFVFITLFLLCFIIWGFFAPINSASIATGKIVLDFNRKTIQHLEGGIVEKILVKEGDFVDENQPLIVLRNIQTKSQNEMFKKQLLSSLVIEERLLSERDNKIPDFNPIVLEYKQDTDSINLELNKMIKTQKYLFTTRNKIKKNKLNILSKRIAGIKDEIDGLSAQENAVKKELKVLYQQEKIFEQLVNSNNYSLSKLLELQKQIAASEGKEGELKASIAKAKQSIAETELEINNLQDESLSQILSELQTIEAKISNLKEQVFSTTDILKRTVIRAPSSGVVTGLKYHTVGAVLTPSAEIMYIVPQDDELVIEAKVKPQDIDSVKEGLKVKVQLTAYRSKKVPKLPGIVSSVSADIITDKTTYEQYFMARIKISEKELKKLNFKVSLYPGMPAQVFIVTGSRSFFEYFFTPIIEAGYKAFRED